MTTPPKAGARAADTAHDGMLERDEQEPTLQSGSAGVRDTRPVGARAPDADGQAAGGEDDAATVLRQSVRPETPSRSRKNTLAMAITRPVRQDERVAEATP
ncbi:MAG: hypothetical protein ACRDHP_15160, partial [Ktedonobacterales bacterium]